MSNEEKRESRRLPGFYIALCCCVIAVGAAGYFTERATDGNDNAAKTDTAAMQEATAQDSGDSPTQSGSDDANETLTDPSGGIYIEPQLEEANAQPEPYEDAVEASNPQVIYEDLEEPEPVEEAAAIFNTPSFSLPAGGEIVGEFSDTLTYNETLCDWRAHSGTDIAVDAGGSVCAAADGTVSRVASDAMGEYVVIDHDGGFSTKYCSLSSVEDISEGDTVKSGDVIGIASECRTEPAAGTHVHFEMYKDGKTVNPTEYAK